MTTNIETCAWTEKKLSVPLEIGEIRLLNPTFNGFMCATDIFDTKPLAELDPPIRILDKLKTKFAYAYSFPVEPGMKRFRINSGFVSFVDSTYKHYFVDTKSNFEDYLSTKKKKTISTLKRKIRKIEATNAEGKTFRVLTSPDEMDEFFSMALPISDKSYQQRLWGQGLPGTDKFRNEIINKSMSGEIIGYILNINDKPVAYNLCPIYGETKVLYDFTGYDSDYSKFSPGTVLQYKIIEDLFQRSNIEYYDLCTGEGVHKELFATDFILCGNIYFFSINPKYVITFSFKFLFSTITKLAIHVLSSIGLKDKLKSFIRRNA